MLEFAKEILNEMTRFVQVPVIVPNRFTAAPGRDNDLDSGLFQGLNHTVVGIISFIGNDATGLNLRQKMIGSNQIVNLPRGQQETRGIAKGVGLGMDFCRQTAS